MVMSVQTYLMTRGTSRGHDYQFIGDEPAERWWDPLAKQVVLEEPELIVAARDGRLGILISGLPSARRDAIGTALRYTVVIDDAAAEPDIVRRLVGAGLTETGRNKLGRLLDESFGGSAIDEILGGADAEKVPELVTAAVRDLPDVPVPSGDDDGPASWVGPMNSEHAQQKFRRRVERLAGHGNGYAFTSHLLSTAPGAESAAAAVPGEVAVLLVNGTVAEVTELGKDRSPGTEEKQEPQPLLLLAATGLVALGALGWIVWWAARRLL
jgi:hypothetical protein